MQNKKGFTLVELLAVIVVLAIIMVIATTNVNKIIRRSRTNAFISSMNLAVKNAKKILISEGNLNSGLLKDSLDYSKDEYEYEVIKVTDGYIVRLISSTTGKFKNVDFDKEYDENNNLYFKSNADGEKGKNIISFKINLNGDTEKIATGSDEEKIVSTDNFKNGCDNFSKKDSYSIGDLISFCNKDVIYKNFLNELYRGKSEDFYVIKDNGSTVTALAKDNLMVGESSRDERNILGKVFSGLQDSAKGNNYYSVYPVAFGSKEENEWGYWANPTNHYLNKPAPKYGESYPAYVYDNNSLLWEPVQNYKNYFINTLNKKVENMRLITYDELIDLGCDKNNMVCKPSDENKKWIYSTIYWTGFTDIYGAIYIVSEQHNYQNFARISFDSAFPGLRPVIEISKSEIEDIKVN